MIFTSVRTTVDEGCAEAITVSYWRDEASISARREQVEHRQAQNRAGEWYDQFAVRVARVERAYERGS